MAWASHPTDFDSGAAEACLFELGFGRHEFAIRRCQIEVARRSGAWESAPQVVAVKKSGFCMLLLIGGTDW